MKYLALILALFSGASSAAVYSVTCSGTITTQLQAAVNSAVDGDTVNISAGSCISGGIAWSNKNITVQGQGIGVTTVDGLSFDVTDTAKANFRITGMSVGASNSWLINSAGVTAGIKGWRIDHIAWNYPSCGQNIAVLVNGINWGLLDHNTFTNAGNAIFLRAWADGTEEVNPWPPSGNPGMGGYSWLLPVNLGTDEAVYVEDNTFAMGTGCYYGVGDMYYGGRMVFRHNSVTNAYFQNHATRGYERGGSVKAEIYNNDFNATDPVWYRAIHLRSGTGVVFNNTLRGAFNTIQVDNQRSNGQNTDNPFGACNGTSAWDGNISGEAGWPCLDQIGRGTGQYPNQPSVPLYGWNNGSDLSCSTGGACPNAISVISDGDPHVKSTAHSNGQVDFVNNGTTPKPGYTAYTYPHPLQGVTPPPPPFTEPSPPSLKLTFDQANTSSIDGATVFRDSSVNKIHCISTPNYIPVLEPGLFNEAAKFDGNDFVNCSWTPQTDLETNFTISAWVKFTNSPTERKALLQKGALGGTNTYTLEAHAGYLAKPYFGFEQATPTYTYNSLTNNGSIAAPNTWQHLVAIHTPTEIIMWIDGVKYSKPNTAIKLKKSNASLWIGRGLGLTPGLSGWIDELKIYPVALTDSQVLTLYNQQ